MESAGLPLSRWQRRGVIALLAAFLLFGIFVVYRTALLKQRMGDLGVFLRAAWAFRAGEDFYEVTERGRWHYCYPPCLAIVLAPLANPPDGGDRTGMLPYPVSTAIWYVLSVLSLAFAVHVLASALEQHSSNAQVRSQPRFCRRWWLLRLVPILVALPPIGHTLMRGQVNLVVLALLCAAAAAALRGRRFQSGMWLSGAICIKIIPAFLLLVPLWRRDGRCLAGCAAGLLVGLVALPVAVFGPTRAFEYNCEFAEVLLFPGMGLGADQSRAEELINVTATDSQSILAVLHNTLHTERTLRPKQASPAVRLTSWLTGGFLTFLAFWAAWRRRALDPVAMTVLFGMLILNMIFLSPVAHLHYFCLSVPLLMGLMAAAWTRNDTCGLGPALTLLLLAYPLANIPSQIPGLELLRDCGLVLYAGLALWVAGLVWLWRHARSPALPAQVSTLPYQAAA